MKLKIKLKKLSIKSFTKKSFNNKTNLDEVDEDQAELLIQIMDSKKNMKPKKLEKKNLKKMLLKWYLHFFMAEKWFLIVLKKQYSQ